MTQKERVLKYISDFGSITRLEAMRDLGVGDLPSVIRYTRADGIDIVTEDEEGINRYGDKTVYGRYRFAEVNNGNQIVSSKIPTKDLWGRIRTGRHQGNTDTAVRK